MPSDVRPAGKAGAYLRSRMPEPRDLASGQCQSLRISSDGSQLADVRRFLEKICAQHTFSDEDCYDLKIAVGEACSNAIEHGSPRGADNEIEVRCCYLNDSMLVEIIDQGIFRPHIPVLDGSLNHRGRGIPFMLALMDEVDIAETPNGTVVRLVKH